MFELTDTLTYVVPVMLSVLVAKTVADALEAKGIYDLVIECVRDSVNHWHINSVFSAFLSCHISTPNMSISGEECK
jgi:hypothetical protein